MNLFIFFFLFVGAAFAQLEKPLLEGQCGEVKVTLKNQEIRTEFSDKKKSISVCVFGIKDLILSERPEDNIVLYLSPVSCSGKFSKNAFIQITPGKKGGRGIFTIFPDQEALSCNYNVIDWNKITKLKKR